MFVDESPELFASRLEFRRRQAEIPLHLFRRHLLNPTDDHCRNSVIVLEAILDVIGDRLEPTPLLSLQNCLYRVRHLTFDFLERVDRLTVGVYRYR
jgi:hypothetical protein